MRLTGSRAYYRPSPPKMPPGLIELMEGLTKDVLKHNPSDVYGFCADHIQQLLDKRDGPSIKKTLPLEIKITKAQEAINLRARYRREEYDKKLLQQIPNATINEVKNDLKVPQLQTTSQTLNVDSSTSIETLSQPDKVMQDVVKTPIHHINIKTFDDLSEIEIAHDIDYDGKCKSTEGCVDNINNLIKGNITTEFENKDNTELGISSSGKLDVDAITPVDNLEINDSAGNGVVAISESSLLSKGDIKEDTPNNFDDVAKGNEKAEESKVIENKDVNVMSEPHTLDNTATHITDKSKSRVNLEENLDNSINIESAQTSNHIENQESGNSLQNNNDDTKTLQSATVKITDGIDDVEQSNDSKDSTQADEIKKINYTENCDGKDPTTEVAVQEKVISDVALTINPGITLQQKNDEKPLVNNDVTQLPSETNQLEKSDGDTQQNNTNLNVHDSNYLEQSAKTVEPETNLDFQPIGVDSDISTLVTGETVQNTHELKNLDKDFTHVNVAKANKNSIDKEISDNECRGDTQHDGEDYSEPIGNSTGAALNLTESEIDNTTPGELSTDVSENIQSDGTNMDLETAAVTIQKVFRTFLFKSRGSTFEDSHNDNDTFLDEDDKNKEECEFPISSALNIDRRAHGITRMDTVLQTVNEEKSLSLSTDDSSTLSSAATIIQAHVRGFLVRSKLNSHKTVSTNSLAASNSNEPSLTSIEADNEQNKNKTVLNIHIVPEGENYLSRDESLITSMDLSLDSSPPSSINLHPLGYDKSERRKQLKREDAIQSISPPSNHSGKLSEDFDSVKELSLNEHDNVVEHLYDNPTNHDNLYNDKVMSTSIEKGSLETVSEYNKDTGDHIFEDSEARLKQKRQSLTKMSSDEMDVVTPYTPSPDVATINLMHSGEFHDAVLPTRVSRSDTSVVSGE